MFEMLIFLFGMTLGALLLFLWKKFTPSYSEDSIKLKTEKEHIVREKNQLLSENQNYRQKEKTWIERSSVLQTKNEQLEQKLKEQELIYKEKQHEKEKYFKQLIEKTSIDFKNIANETLQSKAEHYQKESEKSLNSLLNPLKEKISSFEKTVQENYGERKQQILSLKEEIKLITETGQQLSQALKGNTKVQGDWGEMILKRILENSGLQEGREFIIQGKGLGLKDENKKALKPDVIVKLPDNRDIIIDSKVSLIHYHNYLSEKSEDAKEQHVNQIVSSLNQHIKGLSEKHYYKAEGLKNSLEFVLMFVPLEGVLSLAFQKSIQEGKNFFSEALDKGVMVVSPITLHATLKIIHTLWQIEKRNKNAEEIAKQSGEMYKKFKNFLEDMSDIGKGLGKAQNYYDKAIKKLNTGRGNLIRRAKKIEELRGTNKKESLTLTSPLAEDIDLNETTKDKEKGEILKIKDKNLVKSYK